MNSGPSVRGIDLSRPSVARIYDYLLGGKDNSAADRRTAEELLAAVPSARAVARGNRAFLRRVVRYLVAGGIRQFVDIGSGLPTQQNVHEVAQAYAPGARVVYVDNDPLVLAHGRALLATNDHTTVVTADVREPESLFRDPDLTALIDWSQPVAVLLVAILHFISDAEDPYRIVETLTSAMAPGSYLAISHGLRTAETEGAATVYGKAGLSGVPRTQEQIKRLFGGLEVVEPGLVPVPAWRPDTEAATLVDVPHLGGVARKSADSLAARDDRPTGVVAGGC